MASYCKLLILALASCLSACHEGGEAGDLFGQWRLAGSDALYVSFSGSVTLFRAVGKGQVFGNFQHQGDSLFVQCVSVKGEKRDTAIVEDTFGLKPFTDIRLKIETLSSDRLQLRKDNQTWSFDKY